MTLSKDILVFTDLDGTLIDHDTYSWEAAKTAIRRLQSENIPIIPCTSKTRKEIEYYRMRIGLRDPFISENGGAIFIPEGYFDFDFHYDKSEDGYYVIELGTPYVGLRRELSGMQTLGEIVGFGDMTVDELSLDTGLSVKEAKMAKEREYDEAFKFSGDERALVREINRRGLNWTRGGRYWHIIGDNDKGKAVRILSDLFKTKDPKLNTVGLGDSLNDLPMLKAVDIAILVQKSDGSYDARVDVGGIIKANGIGPVGWNSGILGLLKDEQLV